jgi:hypothetical protein
MFEKDLYELVSESVKKDQDTFASDIERDFFLSMLKHFFTIHDFNNFNNREIDSETYNEFYRETIASHYWDIDMESLEEVVNNQENVNAS